MCPSHPNPRAATGYIINAFAFETKPTWKPSGPEKLASFRSPATLPWILEASNAFGVLTTLEEDIITQAEYHDVWHPDQLPSGVTPRITLSRHSGSTSNVLFLDGHVSIVRPGDLKLEDFDDHKAPHTPPFPF
jgi:prepilin-type processing-associated H-X9-DG protein